MPVAMRDERLEARVTSEQKELFKEAAQLRGQTLTDFIVSCVRETALAVLRERHVVEVSRRDQQTFIAALLGPAKVNPRLRKAAKRHGYLAER